MQLSESSIYLGLKQLREKLYRAQFLMNKADRIIYGTPLMQASGNTISRFTLAFEVQHKRQEYLEECIGWFSVLRTDLNFCISENIIHYTKPKNISENTNTQESYVNSQKVELFKIVAQIDSDMCKWRTSLAKGKTLSE